MSALDRKAGSLSKYDHTDKIASRRKALFPTDDSDSDLGPMCRINSDSNSNFSDIQALETFETEMCTSFSGILKRNIEDYVILDKNSDEIISTPIQNKMLMTPSSYSTASNLSPLYLSPMHPLIISPILYSPTTITQTPITKSPTSSLKTPHDTSTVKVNVKNQKRKMQDLLTNECDDNKMDALDSKSIKLDSLGSKSKKVRTALFPENDISLPVNSFYPKTSQRTEQRITTRQPIRAAKNKLKEPAQYLCNRRKQTKNRYGQINSGVRHKIRKPKQKKIKKASVMKAALNIIETSALNEYLEEMALLKTSPSQKQIKRLDDTQIVQTYLNETNKENVIHQSVTNKRFFKSTRNNQLTTTISSNIRLEVDKNGGLHLQSSNKRKFDDDLNISDEPEVPVNLDNILKTLDDQIAQKSDLILSPTSQMCDMTSGLALNSPKRARLNINALLCDSTNLPSSVDMEQQKLFPIFCGANNKVQMKTKEVAGGKVGPKKWKNLPADQMFLDFGQKGFGTTQCAECQVVYQKGNPNEELKHLNYHNATNLLKFHGWKNERVVGNYNGDKVIKIIPGDSKAWWKKIKDLIEVINRDLGFYETVFPVEHAEVYLYIRNKTIIGCLVAESKQTGYKMLSTDCNVDLCSEESYAIKCGVSRIWVSTNYRKTGVATSLMNTLCKNFIYGYILSPNDIALSSPTEEGKQFAVKYFNTENYLIYIS